MLDFYINSGSASEIPDESSHVAALSLAEFNSINPVIDALRAQRIHLSFFEDAEFSAEEVSRALKTLRSWTSYQSNAVMRKLTYAFESASRANSGIVVFCD